MSVCEDKIGNEKKPQNNELPGFIVRENNNNLTEIKNRISNGEVIIPFVGAGLSCDFGYKTWGDLMTEACEYYEEQGVKVDYGKIRNFIDQKEFELAANKLCNDKDKNKKDVFEDFLTSEFTSDKFNKNTNGCMYELPRLASKYVITTNFDRCLENVFRNSRKPFSGNVYSLSLLQRSDDLSTEGLTLIKIHGTAGLRESRIMTTQDIKDAYMIDQEERLVVDKSKKLPRILQTLASTNIFLFVGCSLLENDRIVQIFKELSEKFSFGSHYAIIELSEGTDIKERNRILSEACIKPIWFNEGQYNEIRKYMRNIKTTVNNSINVGWRNNHDKFFYPVIRNVYDAIKTNSLIRIPCNASQYKDYSNQVSRCDELLGTVIWTMDGSPLKIEPPPESYLTPQDIRFREIKAENKFRVLIFKDIKEVEEYKKKSKRKKAFEESVRQHGGKLLFGLRCSLKHLYIKEYFDFGYITSCDYCQNLIFCGSFESSDFSPKKNVLKEFILFSLYSELQKFKKEPDVIGTKVINNFHGIQELINKIVIYTQQEEQSGTIYLNDSSALYTDVCDLYKNVCDLSENEKKDS